jgi:hypothetical protein
VTLTIQDASGRTVRTLTGTKNAGVNRVMWDPRDEPTAEVRLRVSPLHGPARPDPARGPARSDDRPPERAPTVRGLHGEACRRRPGVHEFGGGPQGAPP